MTVIEVKGEAIPKGLDSSAINIIETRLKEKKSRSQIAYELGVSRAALSGFMIWLGLSSVKAERKIMDSMGLTEVEIDYIRDNYPRGKKCDIASYLGLTTRQLYDYARMIGVNRDKLYLIKEGTYRQKTKKKAPKRVRVKHKSNPTGRLIHIGQLKVYEDLIEKSDKLMYFIYSYKLVWTCGSKERAIEIANNPVNFN